MSKNTFHWVASAAAVLWTIATPVLADDSRWFAFYRALTNEFIVNTNGITAPTDLIRMVDEKWIDSAAGKSGHATLQSGCKCRLIHGAGMRPKPT